MPIPKSDLTLLRLQMLKEFDHEVIDQLVHGVATYVAQEHENLVRRANEIQSEPTSDEVDKGWLVTLIDDDHYFLNESQKLSHELAIVALYKKIEITTKRAVSAAYPDISTDLSKIQNLKNALEKKGINIEKLPHYEAMDETRCLNNDIKHNAVVRGGLAKYPNWKKGEPLQNLDVAYRRLAPLCSNYMEGLVDKLITQRRADISAQQTLGEGRR